jgi:hypothetical protein
LAYQPTIYLGGSVAELSRPAQVLNRNFMEKRRKPQGRKRKHKDAKAKYHNWLSPFLFTQIDMARVTSGGPKWSTRAIVHVLKKKDPKTFQGLSRTTINRWIDRTGNKPKWSERTLERVKRGNEPGHDNCGRKGFFVSVINFKYAKWNLSHCH